MTDTLHAAAGPQTGEAAIRRMSRGRFVFALGACLVGIAILLGLGTWQVERLQWKEGLLAQIDARTHAAPVGVDALAAEFESGQDIAYRPVTATGRFLNAGERYVLSTFEGEAGWNVYTPLLLAERPPGLRQPRLRALRPAGPGEAAGGPHRGHRHRDRPRP